MAPAHLMVDGRAAPLDVTGTPAFGWEPQDSGGNEIQTAYDIVVSNGLTGARVWDSGKVASSRESYVPYAGPALTDGAAYNWTVTTWNREGQQSPAAGSRFDTGLNDHECSPAQWIRLTGRVGEQGDQRRMQRQRHLTERHRQLLRRLGIGRRVPGNPGAAGHYADGHRSVAGAGPAAFRRPGVGQRTEWTQRGSVSAAWHRLPAGPNAGEDTLQINVPDNVTATVSLPAGSRPYTTGGTGAPRYLGTNGGRAIYSAGSGVTTFTP